MNFINKFLLELEYGILVNSSFTLHAVFTLIYLFLRYRMNKVFIAYKMVVILGESK